MVDSIFKTKHEAFATQKATLASAPKFDAAPSQKATHAANVAHHNFINTEFFAHHDNQAKLRHENGQLAHTFKALKVETEFHACLARNEKLTAETGLNTPTGYEDCKVTICDLFNTDTTAFNSLHNFVGETAYPLAVCEA